MNLLYSCADTLDQPATPACTTDYGERIIQIILSKVDITQAGNVPTASEFAVAYTAGTIAIINGISNGHRVRLGSTEIEGVYYKEWYDKEYRVEGRIKLVSANIARACEKYDRYDELKLWFITDKNYCFGSFDATPNFNLLTFNGSPYVDFHLDYVNRGIDYSAYDGTYDNITNIVSVTVDSTVITVDSTTITVDSI